MLNGQEQPVARIGERPRLTLRWGGGEGPLPIQHVRGVGRPAGLSAEDEPPPWLHTGTPGEPFDFCAHVRRLATDVVGRVDELHHVDVGNILFAFTQARNNRRHGLQARVTPLRFHGGALYRRHHGTRYQVQRLFVGGREMLYLMTFCLPRFLNQPFEDRFVTLVHELYHISPRCDGDLRRHQGRYTVHSHSQRRYDQQMAALARAYLATRPDPDLHAFLYLSFAQIQHRHGAVIGPTVPRPKLVPVRENAFGLPESEIIHAAVRHP